MLRAVRLIEEHFAFENKTAEFFLVATAVRTGGREVPGVVIAVGEVHVDAARRIGSVEGTRRLRRSNLKIRSSTREVLGWTRRARGGGFGARIAAIVIVLQ